MTSQTLEEIPNIEEENAVRKEVDLMWSWVDDNKAGSKDFEVDYMKEFESHIRQLIATHHHQLQKARDAIFQELPNGEVAIHIPAEFKDKPLWVVSNNSKVLLHHFELDQPK